MMNMCEERLKRRRIEEVVREESDLSDG